MIAARAAIPANWQKQSSRTVVDEVRARAWLAICRLAGMTADNEAASRAPLPVLSRTIKEGGGKRRGVTPASAPDIADLWPALWRLLLLLDALWLRDKGVSAEGWGGEHVGFMAVSSRTRENNAAELLAGRPRPLRFGVQLSQ